MEKTTTYNIKTRKDLKEFFDNVYGTTNYNLVFMGTMMAFAMSDLMIKNKNLDQMTKELKNIFGENTIVIATPTKADWNGKFDETNKNLWEICRDGVIHILVNKETDELCQYGMIYFYKVGDGFSIMVNSNR